MDEVKQAEKKPFMPPRWFVWAAWKFHRAYYRVTGGRRGLWPPTPGKAGEPGAWGTMRLTVPGRKSGKSRQVILGYYEDGPNYVTLAMNGWGYPEPAWWLNLQAHPDATLELRGKTLPVRGRAAEGEERDRLWAEWRSYNREFDAYAALRPRETAVVVLEPVS
jgi:deazaflavin-dependent oxidoreductase (nitroreductase family)